ncbi:MAG: hypothetical protein QM715_08810 [Nibricoccus sp.]
MAKSSNFLLVMNMPLSPLLFAARRFAGLALIAMLTASALQAEPSTTTSQATPRLAVGLEAGSAGVGPVVVFTTSKSITANVGYTFLSYDYDFRNADTDFDGTLKLSNLQAILNWHPKAGAFHLSAGVVVTNNKMDITAKPTNSYKIGDTTYTLAQIGTLDGTVKIGKGAKPYLGLGWSKTPAKSGFGFFCDIGVIFMESPKVSMRSTGPIASDANFQRDLRKEEQDVNDKLDKFKYYPVIQIGGLYRF